MYRFGFNGIHKENEIAGIGNHYSALYGEYDPRIVYRWNTDPKPVAWESPYAMFRDNPIWNTDPLLDYSKAGAWWRNIRDGGGGIYETKKGNGDWGYNAKSKTGDGYASFFGPKKGASDGGWLSKFGDKLNQAFRAFDGWMGKDNSALPAKEHSPNRGGIVFTSASGQNQERRTVGHPDGKTESIDDILSITGNYGGSGGVGVFLSPLEPMLNINTSTDLLHQAGDRTGVLHDWKDTKDTNINVHDPTSRYGFKTIKVDKSEVGTRYKADSDNITITTDTEQ